MSIKKQLIYSKTRFLRWVDAIVKSYPVTRFAVPIIGLLFGKLVLKGNHYIRYTLTKNSFGHHQYFFPDFEHVGKIDWSESQEQKYFSHETVNIRTTDTVLEVGAARGITTQIASEKGQEVIALEASPRAYECLTRNIIAENVELVHCAAWNEDGEIEIQYGQQSGDDSPITPNSGKIQSRMVRAKRIDNLVDQHVDFLKVEAEGVEPEVIEGMGSMEIPKVVVNCSAERYGASPRDEVSTLLQKKGYEIVDYQDNRLFARHTNIA